MSHSIENEPVFEDQLSPNLIFIDAKAVLHIIDTATRFAPVTFLEKKGETYGESLEETGLRFDQAWYSVYTCYPNRLLTKQGSAFTSDKWKTIIAQIELQLRLSVVRANFSLRIVKRSHDPLRRGYHETRHAGPAGAPRIILKICVKTMNGTML